MPKIALQSISEPWISRAVFLIFAIALQIQITLFSSETYLGLRINAADLFLPVVGLLILASLIFRHSHWPQWEKPFGYWALGLLTLVLGLSLLNGYRIHGDWSHWALLNKGVGWCVLMAYIAAGAWLGRNNQGDIRRWFIAPFAGFLCLVTAIECVIRIFFFAEAPAIFSALGSDFGHNLAGFMVNRNAFAFLYLSTLVVGTAFLVRSTDLNKIERFLFKALWLLLPLFLIFNQSRAALLISIPFILYLIITNGPFVFRKVLPLILIGTLALPFTNEQNIISLKYKLGIAVDNAAFATQPNSKEDIILSNGDNLRLQLLQDSWALIKEHPITGAGLGSALRYQDGKNREFKSVVDNTALWILTEMGPLGLLSFLGVFIAMLVALYKRGKDSVLAMAVFFMLIGFGLFSLLHEVLYSRFLWFFLGLGLSVPNTRQSE